MTAPGHLARFAWLSIAAALATMALKAAAIGISAIFRLLDPQPLTQVGVGLAVSVAAAAVNGAVAAVLLRAGRQHRSSASPPTAATSSPTCGRRGVW